MSTNLIKCKNVFFTFQKKELNAFTLNAIEASGNTSMSNVQKLALNDFFENIGAFGTKSSIFEKLDMIYLPMLATSLNKALVDYKDNSNSLVTPDAEHYTLVNGGLHVLKVGQPLGVRNGFAWDASKRTGLFLSTTDADTTVAGYLIGCSCHYSSGINFKRLSLATTGSGPYPITSFDVKFSNVSSVNFKPFGYLCDTSKGVRVYNASGDGNISYISAKYNKTTSLPSDYESNIDPNNGVLYLMSNVYNGNISTNACDEGAMIFGVSVSPTEADTLRKEVAKLYNVFYPDNAVDIVEE